MTTNIRMSRFDDEKVNQIVQSGSIQNGYLLENGTLRSNVKSTDPNSSLASFVVQFKKFSNSKISEMYDTSFSEFVDVEPSTENVDNDQLEFLTSRLNQLTSELDSEGGFRSLSSVQKDLIIELRIMLGQGTQNSDFVQDFPYIPWAEYLRVQNGETPQVADPPEVILGPAIQVPDPIFTPTPVTPTPVTPTPVTPTPVTPTPVTPTPVTPTPVTPTPEPTPDVIVPEEDIPPVTENTIIIPVLDPIVGTPVEYDDDNSLIDPNKKIRTPETPIRPARDQKQRLEP